MVGMTYWLDLFTGQTWQEFRDYGATVSGFRKRMRNAVNRIKPGDVLLCYLTGVMRWVGALEVDGPSRDKMIWEFDQFPERLTVKPIVLLRPEQGVPMEQLEGKVDFYRSRADRPGFNGFLRMSPNRFKRASDGELILNLLQAAEKEPVDRPVDARKLARKPFYKAESKRGKKTVTTVVSVPGADESTRAEPIEARDKEAAAATRHTKIQCALLTLGRDMGFDLWVARNDRSKMWNGTTLGAIPGMVDKLPTQFNEATNRTIELIDVLWLKGNSIVAAFEVESTTSVYSGLLRMSDLLALQPNLSIDLFLVAPDDRRDKVESELMRPTFKLREKPLASICGFLGFDSLTDKLKAIHELGLASSLKPDFLQKTAEYFTEDDAN